MNDIRIVKPGVWVDSSSGIKYLGIWDENDGDSAHCTINGKA
jgi:hypothetical protein